MANNLTGDFEAVVQVSVRQINGLLATLHHSAVRETAPRPLLHSASIRIGDPHRPKPPVAGDFKDWVLEYQRAGEPLSLPDLRTHLTSSAPPGAARIITDLFEELGDLLELPEIEPQAVRGRARMQISTLTLSVPPGSTSEVTVHAFVRAHYSPDPNTADLPQPIHGQVQATSEVRQTQTAAGKRLVIRLSSDDTKTKFTPASGTGLSTGDVARISEQIRKALRESFPLIPVDLPTDFPFSEFKGVGAAVALPIRLSGTGPPVGNIQSIHNPFVGSSGFAFAVSQEHVDGLLQSFLDSIKTSGSIRVLGFDISVSFSFSPLAWAPGKITVRGRVEFHNPGPNQWIEFSQALTFELNESTQRVAIKPVGEPSVDESFFIRHSTAVRAVKRARDSALSVGARPVNDAVSEAKRRLNSGLKSFDPSASATFTAVEITSDGVIVRGEIGSTAVRYAPIIEVAETNQGQAFTALKSWIPGGRIQQFRWSWVEYANASIWSGVTRVSQPEPHRFIFPKPAGITHASSICLRILGTQTSAQGNDSFVVGGTFCQNPGLEPVLEVPSWSEPLTVPVWLPDSTADAVLKNVIAGHISVQADTPLNNRELTHNFLVYFADWKANEPLNVLAKALGQIRRKDFALVVIAVLPAGAFDSRRREVEARLDSIFERLPARLLLTEDHEGGWTRTFAASKSPSFFLMNARREFVWKHEGELDPGQLAGALDKHLVAGPVPRSKPLRLDVSIGDRAPDILFGDDRGNHIRLRWLHGQPLLLNFWQWWSAPSIRELARLERLAKETGRQAPFIVALHGGKERKMLDEIRKQHGLSYVLAHDPEQRIARIYGVRCWPTTISVNADGIIEHVQFGVTHEHEFPPIDRECEAY